MSCSYPHLLDPKLLATELASCLLEPLCRLEAVLARRERAKVISLQKPL